MNIILLTDLEGINGVTDIGFMERGSIKYEKGCRQLEKSICLAAEVCFQNGVETVYYLDGHGGGNNVREEIIDSRVVKIDISRWEQLMKQGEIDGLIEIGAHAGAGTLNGFLDHTMNSKKWFRYTINGREMNELALQALFCAQFGVPVIACTGDETVCEQAKGYIPEIVTGAVKRAQGRNLAVDYENADEILKNTVRTAIEKLHEISLFEMAGPLTAELTFYRTDMCEEALAASDKRTERVDARTLRKMIPFADHYRDLLF